MLVTKFGMNQLHEVFLYILKSHNIFQILCVEVQVCLFEVCLMLCHVEMMLKIKF